MNSPISFFFQFPNVKKPKTLEKHYQGTLTSVLVDFMSVSFYHLIFPYFSIEVFFPHVIALFNSLIGSEC